MNSTLYFTYNSVEKANESIIKLRDHYKDDDDIKKIYRYQYKDFYYISILFKIILKNAEFELYIASIRDHLDYTDNIKYKYRLTKNDTFEFRYSNKIAEKVMFINDDE